MYICPCRVTSGCAVAASIHIFTAHQHIDICIHLDMMDKDARVRCVDCLIAKTVPIEDIWRAKGIIK